MGSYYIEKLKDPRWQKKRLEVLQRDSWMCQKCFSKDKTLHVHHIIYGPCEPWEISDFYLVTLCEICHQEIEFEKDRARRTTENYLKTNGVSIPCCAACGHVRMTYINVGFRRPFHLMAICDLCGWSVNVKDPSIIELLTIIKTDHQ